ncbi:MAG: ribulose 1,5-bisphosphate carboxylase [Candidatus Brockarchaeota archaeon]|nr:ribulose 1,5-bisphosphate carboxylase [Candidatus Brockarchaeota archaeon]
MSRPEPVSSPEPEKHLFATYSVRSVLGTAVAASRIAGSASLGTSEERILKRASDRFAAKVCLVDEGKGLVKVAYPLDLFEPGNVSQWLSVFGGMFGTKPLESIRLLDVEVPRALMEQFKGPKYGLEGIRRMLGTEATRRPHSGTIFKPEVGMTPAEMAEAAYEAGSGGIDFLKDGEALTNQGFCSLPSRVASVMEALDRVREETGRRVLYAVNVTSDAGEILDRAETAMEHGANCLSVNVFAAGLSSLRLLAEDASISSPIHAHGAVQAAVSGNQAHGISRLAFSKLSRLLGCDQLHVGVAGTGNADPFQEEAIACASALMGRWNGVRSALPAASGGIRPRSVPSVISAMGKDVLIIAGLGVWGHPGGGREGSKALAQAIDAAVLGVPLNEYAESHGELRAALDHWAGRE